MAEALGNLGEYQKAEEHFRCCWEIRKVTQGKNSRATLDAMQATGAMCDMQEKKEEALELFKRCWELRILDAGPDDYDTLSVMHSYSIVLSGMGRLEEAESLLLECLARQRNRVASGEGREEGLGIRCLNSLSNCFRVQEKYIEAEKFARQSLDESRMIFGGNHPETLRQIHTLALSLFDLGKIDEAEALQKECVEKRKLTLGDRHPLYFQSLSNLGAMIETSNRLDEAEAIFKQCSDRERKVLGESKNCLDTMINLANIFDKTERRADAQKIYKECYYKLKEIAGEACSSVALARTRLLTSYHEDGKIAERNEFFNAAGLRSLTNDETRAILQNLSGDEFKNMLNFLDGTLSPYQEKLFCSTATNILKSQKKG